ncbi:NAD-dependent epimerase/dehydratase family protein [Halosimplex amylolyticum]|uniref:NAD-dependent epimerase/dehydratase family protein n=1 Tax=Halosimplex amylolyticum TaxID=3396616 RepID=UPI003F5733D0
MAIDTVAVAGGSGNVGSVVIDQLNEDGYRTVNLDVERLGGGDAVVNRRGMEVTPADEYRRTDLLDAGEVHGSLGASGADAIVHVGTLTSATSSPWHVAYENQVMTSYNLLEAAKNLDIEAVAMASSVCAIGKYFSGQEPDIEYLPVDEDHPGTPSEPYGLGKRIVEVSADGFGRLDGPPYRISTHRFEGVTHDVSDWHENDRSLDSALEMRDPADAPLFSYTHIEDAASSLRQALFADFEGHETFWIVADDTTLDAPTADVVKAFYPDVEVRRSFTGHEGLISVQKARDLLDWEPQHSWREHR